MSAFNNLSRVFDSAEQILFDDSSRIVLMSDCHRGNGSFADDFSSNQNLYFAALTHYYQENYTYIEIGDGDELWKNKKLSDIILVNIDVFCLLSKFYDAKRLYFIFGNHDILKKSKKFVKNNFSNFFDERLRKYIPLFENIILHEGLILKHTISEDKVFLVHGHQVDFFNDELWRLSRFLVKYLWKPLELVGIKNPICAATNYAKKESVEKKLTQWAKSKNQMLIAGHTHRPVFPEVNEPLYFNDGCCTHPRNITGIEIADGYIFLVKWVIKTKDDGTLYVGREILEGPKKLMDYFNASIDSNKKIAKVK